jgi:plasmid stability protein
MATRKIVTQSITEAFAGGGTPVVDREKSIVRGMKIASWKSKNGRDYTAALKGRASIYENAPVSLNHPKDGEIPSAESRIGKYINATEKADGIYADLQYNPKHTHAEQILWAIEHQPDTLANSHRVEAKGRKTNGELKVEQITRVRGVEIVTEGGMNETLFEAEDAVASVEDAPASSEPTQDSPEMSACIVRVTGTGKSEAEARTICGASIEGEDKPEPAAPAATESQDGEDLVKKTTPAADAAMESIMGKTLAELTPSEILAARPDLKPVVLKEHADASTTQAEAAATKAKLERLAVLEAKEARAAKLESRKTLCAGLPAGAATDTFIESLVDVTDEVAAKLVEERKAFATELPAKPRTKAPVANGAGELNEATFIESIKS